MVPEGHGAQVLPDLDLGPKKVTRSHKSGVPSNFCLIKFLPKHMAEAPEAPRTPFMHPVPSRSGIGVQKGDLPPLSWGCSATFVL